MKSILIINASHKKRYYLEVEGDETIGEVCSLMHLNFGVSESIYTLQVEGKIDDLQMSDTLESIGFKHGMVLNICYKSSYQPGDDSTILRESNPPSQTKADMISKMIDFEQMNNLSTESLYGLFNQNEIVFLKRLQKKYDDLHLIVKLFLACEKNEASTTSILQQYLD